MSSLTDRTIDPRDPLAYAPKWARDPVEQQIRFKNVQSANLPPSPLVRRVSSDDIAVTEKAFTCALV